MTTLVKRVRDENPGVRVLFFDGGDCEDASSLLSHATKGAAMHQILATIGCDTAVVGNHGPLNYGYQVLSEYGHNVEYPLLLANLRLSNDALLPAVQPTTTFRVGALKLGVVGVTADLDMYRAFGIYDIPAIPCIRECAERLRNEGADLVIVLSHMGLEADRALAAALQTDISLIIGGHSRDLLPEGEWIGNVFIVQAGSSAEFLGRVDLSWTPQHATLQASVYPITESIPPSQRVLDQVEIIERAIEDYLAEPIGELSKPLSLSSDQECGVGNLMADALRKRMKADIAVVAAGQFSGALPQGPLLRGKLWEACPSPVNPGTVMLSGKQLTKMLAKALDPTFAEEQPQVLHGRARGLLHLSGARWFDHQLMIKGEPVNPLRKYRVAATDFELETKHGYIDPNWDVAPDYEVPTILVEALEDHFKTHSPVCVPIGRLS